MGDGDNERPKHKHRVALPATFTLYTKLIGRWHVMPSVVADLKQFWRTLHEDLDVEVKDNGDFQ